jgi:dephospho-CoA kinase
MLRVGLTGSIAVGKSTVCAYFRDLGCHVLDADRVARDVVEPGTPGLAAVVERFGRRILDHKGGLDRAALASIVFADEQARLDLNAIIHPLVFLAQNNWLDSLEASDPDGIAIVDAALMIESGGYKRFNKLIVVWCNYKTQLSRLMNGRGFSREEAERRIAAQLSQDEKKSYADFLIDTSGTLDETHAQTRGVFEQLKEAGRKL